MPNQVRIGVGVDDKATKPITDIRSAFRSLQNDGAQGFFAGVGAGATIAAFGLAQQAIGGVTSFLGDAAKAAIEDERSVSLLSSSLAANTVAFSGSTDAIEATIKSRERLGFTDEEQRLGLARLLAVTHDVTQAQALLSTAMDLSAFTGQDLVSSSTALVTVEGGRYRMLGQLIGSTKEIKTSEEALAAVHRVTAGAAEDLANTEGGKLKASNVDMAESMDKIGSVILPVLSGGMKVVADVVGGVADVFKGFSDILGAFGDVVGGAVNSINDASTAHNEAADAAAAYAAAQRKLDADVADGIITQEQYDKANKNLSDQYYETTRVTQGFSRGTSEATDELKAASDSALQGGISANELAGALKAAADSADLVSGSTLDSANSLRTEIGALDGVKDSAISAANGLYFTAGALGSVGDQANANLGPLSAEAAYLDHVAFSAAVAARNLNAVAASQAAAAGKSNAAAVRNQRLFGEGAGAGVSGSNIAGGIQVQPFETTVSPYNPGTFPTPSRTGGGGSSANSAASAAKAAADALRNELKSAYAVAEQAAMKTFATIHQGNLDAIRGAKDHAYAEAQVTYSLKMQELEAQKAALYDKSNADQAALNAEQQANRMRDLGEAAADAQQNLADAQAGGDPKQIAAAQRQLRDANEALSEAQQQANIDTEKQQADAAAKEIDLKEKAAKDELAAAQKKADDLAAQATTNENKRYQAEQDAYKASYDLAVAALDDVKKLHSKTNDAILADYEKYKKKYQAKGAEIGASLLKGLKDELLINLPSLTASTDKSGTTSFAVTGQGATDKTTPAAYGGGDVNLNVTANVTVNGSVVDQNSTVAQQIADQLVVGLEKAVKQRGITSQQFFGS